MAGSFVAGVKAALPKLTSTNAAERAEACAAVAGLLLNGNGRDLPMMEIVLPTLLALAREDAAAMVPLATAAQGLWGTYAYPEALLCLDVTMPFVAPTEEALSRHHRPWEDWAIPYTRERELALDRLWRFECLLAVGRVPEALEAEVSAVAGAVVLPMPFKLSANMYEWGDAAAFVVRARIRAVRALRRRAAGGDACGFRKVRKKDVPGAAEASHLRALARQVIDQALPALDPFLPLYAPHTPHERLNASVQQKRELAGWRAEGYAEAGLLARDAGDTARAAGLLATAHWIFSLFDAGLKFIEPEYQEAIRALAPQPALTPATGGA